MFSGCFSGNYSIVIVDRQFSKTMGRRKCILCGVSSEKTEATFHSCIRSKGGYSNNPTSKQFQNILKKLLLHTEISGNEASNVVALDSTSILHCSSSSLEIKISEDMTSSSNSIEEDEDFIQFKNFLRISPW
ncbi:unnamed protein product [Acanthoscelides obtectus]|uniref:Transposable element P transposase-like RNase H C-terminal domain-containing protein n=1 Tax=Acanthoscelides obtectus TaxID=200917 RepID=A0A9P0JXX5_ACAOB|nr:unnamed protein product [Acanthoscelides obtectus]CAK1632105.1 hypothetical protein AOBTE_LOCUS7366 [Acanthoscelides obtectus]